MSQDDVVCITWSHQTVVFCDGIESSGRGSLGMPVVGNTDYVDWCGKIHFHDGWSHSLGRESWTVES